MRADWQLPAGVPRGTWEYGQSDLITGGYDQDLADHPLFAFDRSVLDRWFVLQGPTGGQVVADLGCGTGRALLPLVRRGFRGLAVDLSEKMLQIVRERAAAECLPIQCVRANLVELDCIADGCIDYAMSLFSTLGMIRGRDNRYRALRHVRRILKPGGLFVLHVHNYWYNLHDPGGPEFLIRNWLRATFRRDVEPGDKFFAFRDVGGMFLHVFRSRELREDLRAANLTLLEWLPLAPGRVTALRAPSLFPSLRAYGWMAVCEASPDR